MKPSIEVSGSEIKQYRKQLHRDADKSGYYLNPDSEFTDNLVEGLIVNSKRYGYSSCPCRLSGGSREKDIDIICPCDYRDDDISQYGACYCALYVSEEVVNGKKELKPVPERRGHKKELKANKVSGVSIDVWRCKVCGYLCARKTPPDVCPVCKAKKERFEIFIKS